ncbi:MAG: flagellar basal body P-ring formation chaperone FlgA [Micavibrio sp.]|nr:flagellar basal body P-ring formation chaperone FlgA [Micavibrio sp.]
MKTTRLKKQLKISALALVAAGTLGFALVASSSANALDLRYTSIVEGSTITLGDIFAGLEGPELSRKAERVLGAAPRPGTDMVLDARTLLRIALALDLDWRPGSSADQVVIRRAATVIDQDMIENRLKEALAIEGMEGDFNLVIPTVSTEMILPNDMDAVFEVTSLDFKPSQNRFTAEIAAPSKANPIQTLSVSGTIERLRPVPVLRQTLRAGDVIGARDISYISMPLNRIKHNIILNEQDLIGTTPRRMLTPDQPVLSTEVELPLVVKRGDNVTMIFTQGNLVLTAQGKAMQNGAKGDAIRVTNLNSSKTVSATVTADKEVSVIGF